MIAQAVPLVCLLQLIVYVSSQFVNTPCTKYFRLQKNDRTNEIFGRLEVPSTVENNAINVSVNLSVAAALKALYLGEIKLDDPLEKTLEMVQNGKPLKYNIHFATQDPLPQITGILLNNRQLCTSPKGDAIESKASRRVHLSSAVGPIITNLILNHNMAIPAVFSTTSLPVSTTTPRTTTTVFRTDPPPTKPQTHCGTRELPSQRHSKFRSETHELNKLIMGGKSVDEGDWPWIVAIFTHSGNRMIYTCAGTLVSEKHILTAAHCVKKDKDNIIYPGLYTVVLGRKDIKKWRKDSSMNKDVQRIVVHPKYSYTADSDLAIMTMNSRVEFNKNILPICLWMGDASMQDYLGECGVIIGWGKNETSVEGTDTALMVEVRIVSQGECLETYKDQKYIVTDRTFCAGRENAGPCNGDSGSGLVMQDNSTGPYYLRGIVSTALSKNNECDVTKHVIYVNVAHYTKWIQKEIAE